MEIEKKTTKEKKLGPENDHSTDREHCQDHFSSTSLRSSKKSSIENVSIKSSSRSIPKINTTGGENGTNSCAGPTRLMFVNEKRIINKESVNLVEPTHKTTHKESTQLLSRHTFLSEIPDVSDMEKSLTDLLNDFQSKKLNAFGKNCSMEQMKNIREHQEQLSKLHFEFGMATELSGPSLSDESIAQSQSKMNQLIKRLEQLSNLIEKLHSTQES